MYQIKRFTNTIRRFSLELGERAQKQTAWIGFISVRHPLSTSTTAALKDIPFVNLSVCTWISSSDRGHLDTYTPQELGRLMLVYLLTLPVLNCLACNISRFRIHMPLVRNSNETVTVIRGSKQHLGIDSDSRSQRRTRKRLNNTEAESW